MRDQQAVKPCFGQTAAQLADAAKVVHGVRITGGVEQGLGKAHRLYRGANQCGKGGILAEVVTFD